MVSSQTFFGLSRVFSCELLCVTTHEMNDSEKSNNETSAVLRQPQVTGLFYSLGNAVIFMKKSSEILHLVQINQKGQACGVRRFFGAVFGIGSISADLSCSVFPPRGNRAYFR